MKDSSYVKLMMKEELLHPDMIPRTWDLLYQHGVFRDLHKELVDLKIGAYRQKHGGFIYRKNDKYASNRKLQPNYARKKYQRVIVLKEADPIHVADIVPSHAILLVERGADARLTHNLPSGKSLTPILMSDLDMAKNTLVE